MKTSYLMPGVTRIHKHKHLTCHYQLSEYPLEQVVIRD